MRSNDVTSQLKTSIDQSIINTGNTDRIGRSSLLHQSTNPRSNARSPCFTNPLADPSLVTVACQPFKPRFCLDSGSGWKTKLTLREAASCTGLWLVVSPDLRSVAIFRNIRNARRPWFLLGSCRINLDATVLSVIFFSARWLLEDRECEGAVSFPSLRDAIHH